MLLLNESALARRLLCPSCDPGDGGGLPCPCDPPSCAAEHCRELYRLCTALVHCTDPDNATSYLHSSSSSSSRAEGEPGPDWYFLALAVVLMVWGAVGNVLVCLAVCQERALQNSTNYFLLSLAMADLIVSLCVMPLGAIPGFLGYWPLGVAWCSVYVTSDVLACSASILHMCVISLGRYLGIRSPLRARHRTSKRLLARKVACVWLLAAGIASSITVLGAHDASNIMPSPRSCNINNRAFLLFGSVASFYAPMLLMVGSYALTLHLLRRKARFGAKARAQRLLQQASSRPAGPGAQGPLRQANGGPRAATEQRAVGNGLVARREIPQRSLRIRPPSQLRLSEHKASTVLGLVFAVFVLCWAPFFVLNVLGAVCPACTERLSGLVNLCLWLGYASSTINPIIYTAFNRSFRAALLRVLRCRRAPPHSLRFRSECRSITAGGGGGSSNNNATVTTPSRSSVGYPAAFDIRH